MAYHFITGPTVITFSLWHTNRSINIDNHISLKTTGDFAIIIIICIFNMEATSLSHLYITAYIFYCLISFLIFSLARALSLIDPSSSFVFPLILISFIFASFIPRRYIAYIQIYIIIIRIDLLHSVHQFLRCVKFSFFSQFASSLMHNVVFVCYRNYTCS